MSPGSEHHTVSSSNSKDDLTTVSRGSASTRSEDSTSFSQTTPPRHDRPTKPQITTDNIRLLGSDNTEPVERPLPAKTDAQKVSWKSLPRKGQLAILVLARLSEPLTQTSLQTYLFYQLRSFDPTKSDSLISSQVGLLQGAFTAAQFFTAVWWGRIADKEWAGRKVVIMIGLMGTSIYALGFGFSKSFTSLLVFRLLGGALNGNVGVMRTMISEIIKEKKYQSRAFLLLPMTFNLGVIIGPVLGGLLADPVNSYPSLFGPGSLFGGKDGVTWMMKFPYAPPNLLSACFLVASNLLVFFGLEETHESLRYRLDLGIRLRRWLSRVVCWGRNTQGYAAISGDERFIGDASATDLELQTTPTTASTPSLASTPRTLRKKKLPIRRIWTRNVIFTFMAHGLMAAHVGTFNALWFVYLSAKRYDPAHPQPPDLKEQRPPIHFTGGLSLPPLKIGLALTVLGSIGISLQLIVYPRVVEKLGTAKAYRYAACLFPVAYLLVPFLVLIPSSTKAPESFGGPLIWLGMSGVLLIQVAARTFALPGMTILVNNCCPHPSVLGTVHGIGQTVSSAARTIGPAMGGWIFGYGLKIGVVGLAWWILALCAMVGAFAGTFVRDGSGHEIVLEGEGEEEEVDKVQERR